MSYLPIYQLTRGEIVESIHFGSVAVVDAKGKLIAGFGFPGVKTFLRSSAKPIQAIPFIERFGHNEFGLTDAEIAILCGSHSGTDIHVNLLEDMHRKIGISQDQLLCGIHYPNHEDTSNEMRARREQPTPFRHNCSGKHTGMLALARLLGISEMDLPYISFTHPVQKLILDTFAEMCGLDRNDIELGVDGCSAPNFAVPLYNSALAFARLSDPDGGSVYPQDRKKACHTIFSAMVSQPYMVAGPDHFNTTLMEVGSGRFVSKGGAEGYECVGIKPGIFMPGSPGVGIAVKISDGDLRGKIAPAVAIEIMRQLGALTSQDLEQLKPFGPQLDLFNWRNIHVGKGYPIFSLEGQTMTEEGKWSHAGVLN